MIETKYKCDICKSFVMYERGSNYNFRGYGFTVQQTSLDLGTIEGCDHHICLNCAEMISDIWKQINPNELRPATSTGEGGE